MRHEVLKYKNNATHTSSAAVKVQSYAISSQEKAQKIITQALEAAKDLQHVSHHKVYVLHCALVAGAKHDLEKRVEEELYSYRRMTLAFIQNKPLH